MRRKNKVLFFFFHWWQVSFCKKKRLALYADDIKKQDAQLLAPDPLRPQAKSKKEVA